MRRLLRNCVITMIFVSTVLLGGCGLNINNNTQKDPNLLTPDDYEPIYYLSEEELPEDNYYIVRDYKNLDTYDVKGNLIVNEDGSTLKHDETRFYPLYHAETNFTDVRSEAKGYEPGRIFWVNYNLDEGLIPTMYADDMLIYKSGTHIPTKYALEKFFDDGYTVGVCGLYKDASGNYRYVSKDNDGRGYTMSTSNAVGFDALSADSIYFVSIGDTRVTPLNVSLSGTIKDLKLMDNYDCDIRTGTEKVNATLCCNIHYFSSAETYMFGSFSFISDIIARLNIPSYVTNGYYSLGDGGMFRYVANPSIKDYHELLATDYNETIYTYNEEGYVNGTTIGLSFGENDFLEVINGETIDENTVRKTFDEITSGEEIEDITSNDDVRKTKQVATKSGNYLGSYIYDSVSEPESTGSGYLYKITASCLDKDIDETIEFIFEQTATKEAPIEGASYKIVFKESDGLYRIVKATCLSDESENVNNTNESE